MRILDIVSTVDPTHGGPIEGVKQLGRITRERGSAAEVLSLDDPRAPHARDFPGTLHVLGPAVATPGLATYRYAPRLTSWLRAHAADYDAVIVHGLWQFQGLAAWRALRGSQVPYYVFPHGMLDPWFKHAYPLKHAKKLLYWWAVERRVVRDAQAVLYTSEEERLLARESFPGYRAREVVIGYGTTVINRDASLQREIFLREFPVLRNKRVLLFLSRLHPKKGCDDLIRAFARIAHRDAALQLVMAGPDQIGWQSTLTALAARLGLSGRVTWTGMLSGDVKWGAYRSAEAFVLPSHQENFGIAVAEALGCGVPVLISNKVNIWREIDAAQAGLVRDDTVEGASALLHDWLYTDQDTRQRMRANAASCFRRHFDLQTTITKLHDVLAQPRLAVS